MSVIRDFSSLMDCVRPEIVVILSQVLGLVMDAMEDLAMSMEFVLQTIVSYGVILKVQSVVNVKLQLSFPTQISPSQLHQSII